MRINRAKAQAILFEEAEKAASETVDPWWQEQTEEFSRICDTTSLTHVAFLATALLAKSVDIKVDVWSVKARSKHPGAYSARGLCHGVIVPHAARLGISLGVTGREPLNNQPYFFISRLSRDTVVHERARPALAYVCGLLDSLQRIKSTDDAKAALRAFIYVRRKWNPAYGTFEASSNFFTVAELAERIMRFVFQDSEGGKRAQAIAAGLLDIFAGPERVLTGRINDPSRRVPGDIGIRSIEDIEVWEKVFEVRDKVVTESDLFTFTQKASICKAREAAIVAVAKKQPLLGTSNAMSFAATQGVALTIFYDWETFARQILFWAPTPSLIGRITLLERVFERLVQLEVSIEGVNLWRSLNSGHHNAQ